MELWIRSQDREKLVKIEDGLYVNIPKDFNSGGFSVYTNSKLTKEGLLRLGKYQTKERALEVLDEIYRLLNISITFNHEPYEQADIIVKSCILCNMVKFYQMPKE